MRSILFKRLLVVLASLLLLGSITSPAGANSGEGNGGGDKYDFHEQCYPIPGDTNNPNIPNGDRVVTGTSSNGWDGKGENIFTLDVAIPAGEVTVTINTWDGYKNRKDSRADWQQHEQFEILGIVTDDLKDGVNLAKESKTGTVTLNSEITTVAIHHLGQHPGADSLGGDFCLVWKTLSYECPAGFEEVDKYDISGDKHSYDVSEFMNDTHEYYFIIKAGSERQGLGHQDPIGPLTLDDDTVISSADKHAISHIHVCSKELPPPPDPGFGSASAETACDELAVAHFSATAGDEAMTYQVNNEGGVIYGPFDLEPNENVTFDLNLEPGEYELLLSTGENMKLTVDEVPPCPTTTTTEPPTTTTEPPTTEPPTTGPPTTEPPTTEPPVTVTSTTEPPAPSTTQPAPETVPNCATAGIANIPIGHPLYHPSLDADGDGIACEVNVVYVPQAQPAKPQPAQPRYTG